MTAVENTSLTSQQSLVHTALVKHNGNRMLAGAELNMTKKEFKTVIYSSGVLRLRWAKQANSARHIHQTKLKGAVPTHLSQDEVDAAFRKSLDSAVSLDENQKEAAVALQRFAAKSHLQIADALTGQLPGISLKLEQLFNHRHREIINGVDGSTFEEQLAREKMLQDGAFAAVEQIRRIGEGITKNAQIRSKMADAQNSNGHRPRKPGYAPLARPNQVAVKAEPGSTVNVSTAPQDG